jgi:hypothetical protein
MVKVFEGKCIVDCLKNPVSRVAEFIGAYPEGIIQEVRYEDG